MWQQGGDVTPAQMVFTYEEIKYLNESEGIIDTMFMDKISNLGLVSYQVSDDENTYIYRAYILKDGVTLLDAHVYIINRDLTVYVEKKRLYVNVTHFMNEVNISVKKKRQGNL